MSIPAVKGYIPLSVTLRSQVCDEQGVGQWPMWKRYDSVKGIIDQYVDEPYRDFLARPVFEVDNQKGEEYFFWFTPRANSRFTPLSHSGDDHGYYKGILDKTLAHYHAVVEKLKKEGKAEEASFLQLSLKYAGATEDCVFCGNDKVVVTVWGMRPREGYNIGDSMLFADLFPPNEMHTVRYDLGDHGRTNDTTMLKKGHGSRIFAHQVPNVMVEEGYAFTGWDRNPVGAEVNGDMLFIAQYADKSRESVIKNNPPVIPPIEVDPPQMHHVRFLTPSGQVIKEMDVRHGERILPGLVPQLPKVGDVQCSAWDRDPLNEVINSDRDFKAIGPDIPGGIISDEEEESGKGGVVQPPQKKHKGWLSALLKWLLLALGLFLLFLLLWCFVFGKCHLNLCDDCDCPPPQNPRVNPDPGPRPVPHTGDVQLLLSWSNYNDLDLSCTDPDGNTVSYDNLTVPSGGQLDVDMNNNRVLSSNPIENIYWPAGGAPKGEYKVMLTFFARRDNNHLETPYSIKVKYGGETKTYTGTMTYVDEKVTICTFTID